MNENKKHSNQYSAEDIQRYLKGQMSAQEMHSIETAALDDPFLADAIEGFETAIAEGNEESINTGLGNLNKQFGERIKQPPKAVPIAQSRWWQIAAAAMVLLIMGVTFYNNWIRPKQNTDALAVNEKKQNDSSGLQKPEEERSSSSSAFLDTEKNQDKKSAPTTTPSRDIVSAPLISNSENRSDNSSLKQKKSGSPVKAEDKKDGQIVQNSERLEKAKEKESNKPAVADQDYREKQTEAAPAGGAEISARRNNQLSDQLNNFSGRVVDPNNKPLSNVNLQILQNKTSFITDQGGNFNFATKDSVVDVQVGLVGFEQRNFRLQNNIASNNLVLEPIKQTMDEVVIIGYGAKRKKTITKSTVKVQDAVPKIGWIEYEKYLEKNKNPPETNPLMKGEVVVSFQVKRPASLSDFKIEKSLSKDYDAEAIRLIQEGPAWKLLKGYKTRITVIVKF